MRPTDHGPTEASLGYLAPAKSLSTYLYAIEFGT